MNTKLYKILLIVLALIVSNCSKKLEEPDVLYKKALHQTYKGNFESATKYLNDIDENYPYTEYSNNTTVLLAYSNYKQKKYSEVVGIIDFFIKTNPKSQFVPYLFYIKALSFYDQIENYKKDKQILYDFLEIEKIMTENFKNSIYTKDLKAKADFVVAIVIAGELDVAIQYQRKNQCIASINRYLEALPIADEKNLELIKHNAKICLEKLGITNYNL